MISGFFHKNLQQIRIENCSEQGRPQGWTLRVARLRTEGLGQGCGMAVIQRRMANCRLLLVGIPEGSGDFPTEMSANSSRGCSGGMWIVV